MTEIYLIRHGEAEGNVFRRMHGQYNSLLTPRGHAQVSCLQKRFQTVHIDACYASDLTRASLTARSIYIPKNLPLRRDARFREIDLGVWDDLTFAYLDRYESAAMAQFTGNPAKWTAPGAESFDIYTQRFIEAMEEAAQDHDGGSVAIFAHSAVMRGVLLRLLYGGQKATMPLSDNAGVSKLIYQKGQFSQEYLGDNSHIPPELSTNCIQAWWREHNLRSEANLYFLPFEASMNLPKNLALPDSDSRGVVMVAFLQESPVGVVSMAAPDGFTGKILGMSLVDGYAGRFYGDQLLGCAVSHFRRLGCRELELLPGSYPDDLINRYEFDPESLRRSIDANAFSWS